MSVQLGRGSQTCGHIFGMLLLRCLDEAEIKSVSCD